MKHLTYAAVKSLSGLGLLMGLCWIFLQPHLSASSSSSLLSRLIRGSVPFWRLSRMILNCETGSIFVNDFIVPLETEHCCCLIICGLICIQCRKHLVCVALVEVYFSVSFFIFCQQFWHDFGFKKIDSLTILELSTVLFRFFPKLYTLFFSCLTAC